MDFQIQWPSAETVQQVLISMTLMGNNCLIEFVYILLHILLEMLYIIEVASREQDM